MNKTKMNLEAQKKLILFDLVCALQLTDKVIALDLSETHPLYINAFDSLQLAKLAAEAFLTENLSFISCPSQSH